MQIEQRQWTEATGWTTVGPNPDLSPPHLVLTFGAEGALARPEVFEKLQSTYPDARIVGCSTAGEILDTRVLDDTVVATAIHFQHAWLRTAEVSVGDPTESADAGRRLAAALDPDGLVHVFVLSEGLGINGSALVRGIVAGLPDHVAVTGGLSGDGARFGRTLVTAGGAPRSGLIAAVGFYGDRLRVGYASLGGWDTFGPDRLITRSQGSVLYELDGQPALELYKNYLGPYAADLPASGLLFPLSLRSGQGGDTGVVRTILSVDEEAGSIVFAGDIPQGSYARLMKTNFERLIDGATGAAVASYEAVGSVSPDLAILISCVGRKLVLKQRIEEEVESVRDVLGTSTVLSGFYSYGEISPFTPSARCELHNQTMTITTLAER